MPDVGTPVGDARSRTVGHVTWHAPGVDSATDPPRKRPRTGPLVVAGAVVVAFAALAGWAAFVRDLPDLDAAADTIAVPDDWTEMARETDSDSLCIDLLQSCDTVEVTWAVPALPDAAALEDVATASGWDVESIAGCDTPQDRCLMTAYVDDDVIVRVTTDIRSGQPKVTARFR